MAEITQILQRLSNGDPLAAEELTPLVYQQLRKMAQRQLTAQSDARVWDATELVHEAYIRLIAKTPDGTQEVLAKFGMAITAASANESGRFLIALSDGRLLQLQQTPLTPGWVATSRGAITTGILLPRHSMAITFDAKGWAMLREIATGKLISEQQSHHGDIWAVSCDRDETMLATVGEDQQLRCFELPSLALRFEKAIQWGIRDVCVAPDGTWIAAAPPAGDKLGGPEGTIALWDAGRGDCQRLLKGHDNWVLKLAVTEDGAQLVSTAENRSTRVWNLAADNQALEISPPKRSTATLIAFDRRHSIVLLGHRDGWVTAWKLANGSSVFSWPAFGDALTSLEVTEDDRVLVTSRSDHRLRIRDFAHQTALGEFDVGVGNILSFQLSRDQVYLAAAGQNGEVTIMLVDPTLPE